MLLKDIKRDHLSEVTCMTCKAGGDMKTDTRTNAGYGNNGVK
jgi:hypothetical protein